MKEHVLGNMGTITGSHVAITGNQDLGMNIGFNQMLRSHQTASDPAVYSQIQQYHFDPLNYYAYHPPQ